MAKLRFDIRRIHADRTQYKPYMFELNPTLDEDLVLEVEMPDDLVATEERDLHDGADEIVAHETVHIITPEGLSVLLDRIASPLQSMNDRAMQRRAGR